MTVKIRETDYGTAGGDTYPVDSDAVRGHLMIVASGGDMSRLEESFGDEPDPSDSNFSIVQYDPDPPPGTGTGAERVRTRLKALVDDTTTYTVIGVTADTVWSDGSTIEAQPAFALGDTVFYDTTNCDGNGRWIRGLSGDEECTNSVGMLYHELAHAFRNHGLGDLATEEAEAIDDENDLREAQGLDLRDRDRLEGGCDCPNGGCCIVASVAYETPWATEIKDLRRLRDYTLRSSAIGSAFFEELHREYYAFSIDICRVMVQSRDAHQNVAGGLVEPLVAVLEILRACAEGDGDPGAVGRVTLKSLATEESRARPQQAGALLPALAAGRVPAMASKLLDPETNQILHLLAEWLPRSPHVQWGIVEPLQLWLDLGNRFGPEDEAGEVGRWVLDRYAQWITRVPISDALCGPNAAARAPNLVQEFAASVAAASPVRTQIERTVLERIASRRGGDL